ncbi:probable ubiquitin carboxyl-terminal hydrolase MINDY-4 [Penaeus monodon]|uniref:probable ubiquitin carboxyl-terminal hydrolase MINDY-4 n=1 Tax=Penaeus monodon TaxID=6687 RepID=UPI0018A6E54A|nr:probable ubiquitin carboxyl-terminal hydrolase MINDY-4 [Penaeus monodon]
MFSGAFNGFNLADSTVPNGSLQLSIQGKSVFDTEADDDIVQMAAQRDQLRGARNIRGMMAPVMSKEEDPRNRSANRRFLLTKQRSESMLGEHEESQEDMFPSMDNREEGDEDVVGSMNRRRGIRELGGLIGGLGGIGLRPSADYLSDLNRRGDIMAQSMRRQSLKGSKQNLLEGGFANFGSNDSSRMSIGTVSPEEFLIFKSENDKSAMIDQGTGKGPRKGQPRFIPNSHEDIQILNLQGFMDASSFANDLGNLSKRKQRKKRGKRGIESGQIEKIRDGYKQSSRPRRKRSHRLPKTHLSDDDDGELTLKDIDDLDNKVAGLVIGPRTVNTEAAGTPITLEEASHLRNLLTGSPANTMPAEWMQQNFKQNANPNLSYGLVQNKGGPCGVLACVQAYMMKCLIFGTPVSPSTSPVSPLRPSQREWSWALASAITEILWKAGEEKKAILALPGSFAHFAEHGVGRYSNDGVTENLNLHEFVVQGDLYDAVNRHMSVFTAETGSGCVILLYSLLLTRGLENVETDKDAGGGHLLNAHGYSSQEIVNLLLTGIASTNTFNGDQTLGSNSEDKVVLKGVHHRSDIGLLSLFEHYDCYKNQKICRSTLGNMFCNSDCVVCTVQIMCVFFFIYGQMFLI